jgi:hypothetical protein
MVWRGLIESLKAKPLRGFLEKQRVKEHYYPKKFGCIKSSNYVFSRYTLDGSNGGSKIPLGGLLEL